MGGKEWERGDGEGGEEDGRGVGVGGGGGKEEGRRGVGGGGIEVEGRSLDGWWTSAETQRMFSEVVYGGVEDGKGSEVSMKGFGVKVSKSEIVSLGEERNEWETGSKKNFGWRL